MDVTLIMKLVKRHFEKGEEERGKGKGKMITPTQKERERVGRELKKARRKEAEEKRKGKDRPPLLQQLVLRKRQLDAQASKEKREREHKVNAMRFAHDRYEVYNRVMN